MHVHARRHARTTAYCFLADGNRSWPQTVCRCERNIINIKLERKQGEVKLLKDDVILPAGDIFVRLFFIRGSWNRDDVRNSFLNRNHGWGDEELSEKLTVTSRQLRETCQMSRPLRFLRRSHRNVRIFRHLDA